MSRRTQAVVAMILATTTVAVTGQPQPAAPRLTEELKRRVEHGLQWTAFWRPGSFFNYIPGQTIPVKLVESPTELVVFLSNIRLSMKFRRSSGGDLYRLEFVDVLSTIGGETADSDVRFYIDTRTVQMDMSKVDRFSNPDGKHPKQPGTVIPIERMRVASPLQPQSFRTGDATLRLPVLSPPEYVRRRIRPAGVQAVVAAVSEAVRAYLNSSRKRATIVVPYFSHDDPCILVYVDFHEPGNDGVFWVVHDSGDGWSVSNFAYNSPKNGLGPVIRKIRALALVQNTVNGS
jgi:hypothetical protein